MSKEGGGNIEEIIKKDLWMLNLSSIDSHAVSVFVVILVELDKY